MADYCPLPKTYEDVHRRYCTEITTEKHISGEYMPSDDWKIWSDVPPQ